MKYGKNWILGLLIVLPRLVVGQTVDFSFTTADGLYCNPQKVTFTANCSGTPDGYIWKFGNGVSAIHAIESTTYTNAGTYTVTLIAIYADVAISVSKPVVINPTPSVDISADTHERCQPGTINFLASGSPTIISYEWNFGDGSPVVTTASSSVSHHFAVYDEFYVSVKAITAAGCSSIDKDTVRVKRFAVTDGEVDPPGGCIPISATLNVAPAAPPGDPILNFVWNFGDGSPTVTTITASASHVYNTTATINTASVLVTTASGCSSQYTFDPPFGFGVPPTNPVATTDDGRDTYCGSETIHVLSSATGANYFLWDWGDGNKDSTVFPAYEHRYRTLGPKRVIMTPYFNGCPGLTSDTIDLNIIGVIADYDYHNICTQKNKFTFDNLSLGNVSSFRWTFSDVPNSPDAVNYNVSHVFPLNGTFDAEFYLYDDITGCSDSLTTTLYTATPVLVSTKSHVCKDSLIRYDVLNPYPPNSGYLYAYHINGPIVAHTQDPWLEYLPYFRGSFIEFVVISGPTNNTCDDTVYLPRPTTVGGPVLDFSIPFNDCLKGNSFPITNNTYPYFPSDLITQWDWDFGDNTFSNVKLPPPHVYDRTGTFMLHFKATDINGCAQRDSQLIRVFPTPEIYVLPRFDTLCQGQADTLMAFTVDPFIWTTNYNISCLGCDTTFVNPAHSTDYIATATNIFGCANSDTSRIKVYEPFVVQVNPADTSLCIGGQVRFNTNTVGRVEWSPPDFLSAINIRNPISIPDTSITYQVIVTDSAGCYADTTQALVQVNYKPTVNAGPDQVVPYYNQFTLSPAYSADAFSYRWTPALNQLSCISCAVVSGIASETTRYTVEVANQYGCKATDEVMVTVACNKGNLYLPTGFTPNNDGKNDQFYPITHGYKIINHFTIFDRWGNKIFDRRNFLPNTASLGWDGRLKDGQIAGTGTFVWMIEAICDVGQVVQSKGTVTVIR